MCDVFYLNNNSWWKTDIHMYRSLDNLMAQHSNGTKWNFKKKLITFLRNYTKKFKLWWKAWFFFLFFHTKKKQHNNKQHISTFSIHNFSLSGSAVVSVYFFSLRQAISMETTYKNSLLSHSLFSYFRKPFSVPILHSPKKVQ